MKMNDGTISISSDESDHRLHELSSLTAVPASKVTISVIPSSPLTKQALARHDKDIPSPKDHGDDYASLGDVNSEDYREEDAKQDARYADLIREAEATFTTEQANAVLADLREIGQAGFIRKYMIDMHLSARTILMAFNKLIPRDNIDLDEHMKMLKLAIAQVLKRRAKRKDVNTVEDVVHLLENCRNIVVLSGAGVSTSCGIPDFRSPQGIYANLKRSRPDLSDPQEMFDLRIFREDPNLFYSFAKELYPTNFKPSASHYFIKRLEEKQRLLRNYTQNIDTLESVAGIHRHLPCHGSFEKARCIECHFTCPCDNIKENIFAGTVPLCPECTQSPAYFQRKKAKKESDERARKRQKFSDDWNDADDDNNANEWAGEPLMKPTITFFGEKLSGDFDLALAQDRGKVDLLIVIGTSLQVAPVALLPHHIPHSVPRVLINRDWIQDECEFDVALLGDSDKIVTYLSQRLQATQNQHGKVDTVPWAKPMDEPAAAPRRIGMSHIWAFEGGNLVNRFVMAFDPDRRPPSRSGLAVPPAMRRSSSRTSADSRDGLLRTPSETDSEPVKRGTGRPPKRPRDIQPLH